MRRPRFSPRFTATATVLLLTLPVAYLTIFYSAPIHSTYFYPQRIRLQGLAALLVGGWLVWKWRCGGEAAHTPIDLPIVALLAVALLSALLSTDARLSLETVVGATAGAIAFYLLLDLVRFPTLRTALLDAVLFIAVLTCATGLYRVVRWYIDLPPSLQVATWPSPGRAVLPPRLSLLGNPNTLAAYLVLVLPLGAYRWGKIRTTPGRMLGALGLIAGLAVLLLTQSRGGVVGLLGAALTGLWSMRRQIGRRQKAVLFGLLLLAVAGGGLVLLQRGFNPGAGSDEVRLECWRVAFVVMRKHPLLGSGPGTFGQQLIRYRDPLRLREEFAHAHSMYLTLTAEMGGLGLLAVGWLAGAFLLALRRSDSPGHGFTLDRAGIAGLAGWGVHGLVDSFLDKPTISLHAFLLAALVLTVRGQVSHRPSLRRTLVLTLVSLALAGATLWINWGFAAFSHARAAAYQEDWESAREWMETATTRDPANWYYRRDLALTYGHLACGDASWRDRAIAAYEDHLRRFDAWAPDHANLAALLAEAGKYDRAVAAIETAHRLDPGEAAYPCLLGRYLEAAGRLNEALGAFSTCLAHAPRLVSASFWEETPWRASAMPQILQQAIQRSEQEGDTLSQALLYAAAGDSTSALSAIERYRRRHPLSPDADLTEAQVLIWAGDLDRARERLEDLVAREPAVREAWLLLGRLYLEEGEVDRAAEAAAAAQALGTDEEGHLLAARVAEAQGDLEGARSLLQQVVNGALYTPVSSFAPWTAHRLPLEGEWLPCVRPPRRSDALAEPALALGRLLEAQGRCEEAVALYHRVLDQEPALRSVQERLERIRCPSGGAARPP
ncbi:MAG TPA: tetratricopeptide repeat protein [Chloroflexi bacterium]|nr:tetratricopeptide repeat protein [Chloroflexota bacterium]